MTHSTNIYDTENEAVAKALGKGLPDHERPVFWGAALHDRQADEVARAATAALDAHRATVPHVITTVEELEALPNETVIDAQNGIYQRDPNAQNWGEVGGWWLIGSDLPFATSEIVLPATVLTPTPEPTVKPSREAVIHMLFDQCPDDWDENDIGILTDAFMDLLPGKTEREVREETVRDSIALLDGSDPGWPRHPYSPMSCLADHTEELVRAKGATSD